MKKVLAFIMVGLVYVVIAMAASWANSSTALDKTLETIGIAPGSANTSGQHSGAILKDEEGKGMMTLRPEERSKHSEEKLLKKEIGETKTLALNYPIPPPPIDPKV
ncbi:MAG TPA: hypothetical protein PLP19_21905 [bacterium]|nr:hypothetical protein [bacterium]HPN46154.1 hypothetical protein [bacterium]